MGQGRAVENSDGVDEDAPLPKAKGAVVAKKVEKFGRGVFLGE